MRETAIVGYLLDRIIGHAQTFTGRLDAPLHQRLMRGFSQVPAK